MRKRKYELDEYGIERLKYHILRRAYQDYYECCLFVKKLPRRPLVKEERARTGRKKRKMTDHEFHLWLVAREYDRRAKKRDLLRFFSSEWYYLLSERQDEDYRGGIQEILDMVEMKRRKGLPLFDSRYNDNDLDESEE